MIPAFCIMETVQLHSLPVKNIEFKFVFFKQGNGCSSAFYTFFVFFLHLLEISSRFRKQDLGIFWILLVLRIQNLVVQINSLRYFRQSCGKNLFVVVFHLIGSFISACHISACYTILIPAGFFCNLDLRCLNPCAADRSVKATCLSQSYSSLANRYKMKSKNSEKGDY